MTQEPRTAAGMSDTERRLLAQWNGTPEDLAALVMQIQAEALPTVEALERALCQAMHDVKLCKWGTGIHALIHDADDPVYESKRNDLAAALLAALTTEPPAPTVDTLAQRLVERPSLIGRARIAPAEARRIAEGVL